MSAIILTLHLAAEDAPPSRGSVHDVEGTPMVRVNVDGHRTSMLATPRVLRAFAEDLLELADEACREEDRLSDVPLPLRPVS